MTALEVLEASDRVSDLVARLPQAIDPLSAFDNRDTWDNVGGGPFDNRPTWDNWVKK